MVREPLSDDLVRAIERTRAEFKFARLERLVASGLPDTGDIRTARFGHALVTDWTPMPRVFCLDHRDLDRLDAILAWYAEADRAPHLEFLPLDGNRPLFDALAHRGFDLRYTVSVLLAKPGEETPADDRVRVSPDDEIDAWSNVYIDAHGWECSAGERPTWVAELAVQYTHPGITRYVAEVDGAVAAIDAACHGGGPHAHLTNCATLAAHRGRGLHAALIRRRLRDLGRAGVTHPAADTMPYSISHRNLERAEFRIAYQKTHWERPS